MNYLREGVSMVTFLVCGLGLFGCVMLCGATCVAAVLTVMGLAGDAGSPSAVWLFGTAVGSGFASIGFGAAMLKALD
jgi:hypothetical protein